MARSRLKEGKTGTRIQLCHLRCTRWSWNRLSFTAISPSFSPFSLSLLTVPPSDKPQIVHTFLKPTLLSLISFPLHTLLFSLRLPSLFLPRRRRPPLRYLPFQYLFRLLRPIRRSRVFHWQFYYAHLFCTLFCIQSDCHTIESQICSIQDNEFIFIFLFFFLCFCLVRLGMKFKTLKSSCIVSSFGFDKLRSRPCQFISNFWTSNLLLYLRWDHFQAKMIRMCCWCCSRFRPHVHRHWLVFVSNDSCQSYSRTVSSSSTVPFHPCFRSF